MAKLSAHGRELARLDYPAKRLAYMSDGQILQNYGNGWKLWRKVKAGLDPAAVAAQALERYRAKSPIFHEYVKRLKDAAPMEWRATVNEAIRLSPHDPDGAWADINDLTGCEIDLDDVLALCRLRQAAELQDAAA